MEKTCKQCKANFCVQKGLVNFCSVTCKAKYSSTINENKNESIKFFSSLVPGNYSKIWIKNCKKCSNLYIASSKEKKCCNKCSSIQTSRYCLIYIGKCRNEVCFNLATRKNSYKKIYCKTCALRPYKTHLLKKEIQKKIRVKKGNPYHKKRIKQIIEKNCLHCGNKIFLQLKRKNQLCCNDHCYREYCRVSGRYSQMGKKSAQVQSKRSKNEILLAELLSKEYSIETNFKLIDNWDCDIYIKELNVAILWDGQWHRVQISKKQSLKQVQNRDRIKRELFIEKGVNIITINDYGKYNQEFVKSKFEEVLEVLHNNVKDQFNIII